MNGQPGIGDMIGFSWNKSKEILFPFNFKRWFKILIIVWLAAAGIQGCNLNFNLPPKPERTKDFKMPSFPAKLPPKPVTVMQQAPESQKAVVSGKVQVPAQSQPQAPSISMDAERIAKLRAKMAPPKRNVNLLLVIPLMIGFGILAVSFFLFLMWLTSRFNFILLNTVVTRDPAIKEPFKQYKEAGNSYFVWNLMFALIGLSVLTPLVFFSVAVFAIAKTNIFLGVTLGILAGLVLLAAILALIVIGVIVHEFVLPIMYKEKTLTMATLRKFLGSGRCDWREVLKYLLVVFGLWIVAAIIQGIVGIIAIIGGVIAGGMIAIPGVILIKTIPFLKVPLFMIGGLLAVALIIAVIVMTGMVMLPVAIFFRTFALTYLTRLYPDCDLLGFEKK